MSVVQLCARMYIPQFKPVNVSFYIGESSQIEQCFTVIQKSQNINIIVMQAFKGEHKVK